MQPAHSSVSGFAYQRLISSHRVDRDWPDTSLCYLLTTLDIRTGTMELGMELSSGILLRTLIGGHI
jgi:hypothetical protein